VHERARPILVRNQIGIINAVVVDRPKHIRHIIVIAACNHLLSTHIPHREIRRVGLRDNLRQLVTLMLNQRGGDPTQRHAPARPDLRDVPFQRSGCLIVEEVQPGGADPIRWYTCTCCRLGSLRAFESWEVRSPRLPAN
jgi:hypothetical protein